MSGWPIDQEDLPGEYEHLFTADQIEKLLPRSLWVILVRMAPKGILGSAHKAVAFALHTYVMGKGDATCWPSQETLALNTGLSERTVRRVLAELEGDGWIERESISRRQSHVITLCWPPYQSSESGNPDWSGDRQRGPVSHVQWTSNGNPSPATVATSPATVATSPATDDLRPAPVTGKGIEKVDLNVKYMASEKTSDVPPGCDPFIIDGEIEGYRTPRGELIYFPGAGF